MTEALRAAVLALVNAAGAMLIAFHVVLTTEQLAAVGVFVNTALVVVALALHAKSK